MNIKEAVIDDIKQIQRVRNWVTENTLSDPNLVTDKDCEEFINVRGKGWVCEIGNQIVGFSIADLKDNNIGHYFYKRNLKILGIVTQLHEIMLGWYFNRFYSKISGNQSRSYFQGNKSLF